MPTTPEPRTDREAELIAAAAADELAATEVEEYAALVAADPTVAVEVEELRTLLARLDEAPSDWAEPEPGLALEQRVLSIPHAQGRGDMAAASAPVPTPARRRWLPAAAAAVVLLGAGGVAGAVAGGAFDGSEAPPEGPPGTLGAVEPIAFEGEPAGVDIEASLVAHTWGTETVLDMDGWPEGASYQVVLVGTDGGTSESGSFLGSQVPIVCHLNAALLREEVVVVEIRDAEGRIVAQSDVPEV